jgi:hypothetical protein
VTEEAVIELGDTGQDRPEVPARASRALRRSRVRLLGAIVVTALVWTLAGAAPSTWRLGPPLWQLTVLPLAGGPAVTILGGSLYTWDGAAVTARDPLTAAPRWRVDVPGMNVAVVDVAVAGVVAIRSNDDPSSSAPDGETVRFVDAANGRLLLTAPGFASTAPTGDPNVVMVQQRVDAECRGLDLCADYVGYSLNTGERRWVVRYDPAARVFPDHAAQTIAVLTDEGDLTVRRLATGEVISRGRVPWHPTGPISEQPVALIGDTLVTAHFDGDITLRAIAVGPGGTTWTRQLRSPPGDARSQLSLFGCGGPLCLFDGASVREIDPQTGQTREPAEADVAVPGEMIPADEGVYLLIGDSARPRHVARLLPDGALSILGTVADVSQCQVAERLLFCDGYGSVATDARPTASARPIRG